MSDRIPPHNLEAEQSLLGCFMLKPVEIDEVLAKYACVGRVFFDDRNRFIFEAIADLRKSNRPIELAGLSQLLKDRNQLDAVGGISLLSTLENNAPCGDTSVYFAQMLIDLFVRREQIRVGAEMVQRGYAEPDVAASLAEAEVAVLELGAVSAPSDEARMVDLVHGFIDVLEEAEKTRGKLRGLPTGLAGIDANLKGLKAGQLIVLAARPGAGKTSLAMNVAEKNAVDWGIPTGVLSLEMDRAELTARLVCSRAGVDSQKAMAGELDDDEKARIASVNPSIAKAPLRIYSPCDRNLQTMASIMRRSTVKYRIELWVVDYLQLMTGTKRNVPNRVAEVTEISAALKSLARELKTPILALSQLNRANDKEERRPRLSDLRDSGSIEQDADIVMLLSPAEGADPEAHGALSVDCQIAKHRSGRTGTIKLIFDKTYTASACARSTNEGNTLSQSAEAAPRSGGGCPGRRCLRSRQRPIAFAWVASIPRRGPRCPQNTAGFHRQRTHRHTNGHFTNDFWAKRVNCGAQPN